LRDRASERFQELFGPEFGHGKPFDLKALRHALEALGSPHAYLPPVIHVTGTNGKGSTIAFMRAIAEAAGFKVHAFTKPHLFRLNERFVVGSELASDEVLIEAANDVARVGPKLTQFDAQVAAAFALFHEHHARLTLIETGMGGTTIPPTSSLACRLRDHPDRLGSPGCAWRELCEIATHKAGILKPGAIGVVTRQEDQRLWRSLKRKPRA
jgi:dihydrofolate synthase/folylpolyglutamate synthase